MAKGVQNGKVSNLKNTIRFLVEFYVLAPKQKELLGLEDKRDEKRVVGEVKFWIV